MQVWVSTRCPNKQDPSIHSFLHSANVDWASAVHQALLFQALGIQYWTRPSSCSVRVSSQGVKVSRFPAPVRMIQSVLRVLLRNYTSLFLSGTWSWVSKVNSCAHQTTPESPLIPHHSDLRACRSSVNGWNGDEEIQWKLGRGLPQSFIPFLWVSTQSQAKDLYRSQAYRRLNCLV